MRPQASTDGARAAKADALAAFKAGDYATASALFTRAISLGGEEPHALHANVAACQEKLGKHEAALEAANAAINANGSYVKGHYRRALALSALERWDDAVVTCRLALHKAEAGPAADQLSALLAKCEENSPTSKAMDAPSWMKGEQKTAWEQTKREQDAAFESGSRAQDAINARAAAAKASAAAQPPPPPPAATGVTVKEPKKNSADMLDERTLARMDANSAPREAISAAAVAAAERARDEIQAKAKALSSTQDQPHTQHVEEDECHMEAL